VTNRERERRLAAQSARRDRREVSRKATAARLAARRRQLLIKNGLPVLGAVVVVGALVAVFAVLGGGKGTATASASGTPSVSTSASGPALNAGPLATKPVMTAGTGTLTALKVTTLIQGDGPAVKSGQTISANYIGIHYDTGAQFDSTWDNGPNDPLSFQIGVGKVIEGWDKGLVGVKVGSRVQLDIPQALAYADPVGNQPAGPLRFVIDVLAANDEGAVPLPSSSDEDVLP
jgi:peptidylprolyl isomerase